MTTGSTEFERLDPIDLPVGRTSPFDPPDGLQSLREHRPLCPLRSDDGHVSWLVTSYALAREVLADPRFGVCPSGNPISDTPDDRKNALEFHESPEFAGNVLMQDPPQHTRVRRTQTGLFTVRRVEQWRPSIQRIIAQQLDAMEEHGPPADFVEVFALPVPSLLICDLLGAPPADRVKFEMPSKVAQDMSLGIAERTKAMRELWDYTRELIALKRAQPGNDLLSELVASGQLTDDELVGAATLLFEGGHETTATMFAFGTFLLLTDISRWEYLRSDASLIAPAVEEMLRYLTILHLGAVTRTAQEDVVLEGRVIKAGEGVTVSLTAANRDPNRFSAPDDFRITRDANGHLAFGHGRHMCLGQHLARLELELGFSELLRRFPTLRLAVEPEQVLMYSENMLLYGPRQLPVTWEED